MNILYNIIVSEPSISFCVTVCDTVSCGMIVCNITLTPNPKVQNKKINENEIE